MKALKIALAFAAGLAVISTDCAGARTLIKGEGAKFNVSLSRTIRDSSGTTIPSERLEIVGSYSHTGYGWGILWSFVSLNSIDISKSINTQVENAGGVAITNLAVNVSGGFINHIPFLNLLPIWPGCAVVEFIGDIVRIKPDTGRLTP